jgi:hypothetical protein
MQLNTVTIDTDQMWNPPHKFIVPRGMATSWWTVESAICLPASPIAGRLLCLGVFVNGGHVIDNRHSAVGYHWNSVSITHTLKLSAGNEVTFQFWQDAHSPSITAPRDQRTYGQILWERFA